MNPKPILKIGIDLHGVADALPEFFSEITRLFVENGHEVHIVTGSEKTPALEAFLKNDLGLSFTHLFSITSHHRAIGTDMDDACGHPVMEDAVWNRTKADYCEKMGIHLHLDDSPVYGSHFKTPYARFHRNLRSRMKQKIAVMGGSFNPVTCAHLAAARAVLDALPMISQVWLMPAFRHPFDKHGAYDARRGRMIRMVETDRIRYFGYEIDHELSGESYLTFSRLLSDPDYALRYEFYMVIGSDCALDFDRKWRHAGELAETVPFIILPRPGYSLNGYSGLLSGPPHIVVQDAMLPDISASEVRRRIAMNEPISGLVPPPVEGFIRTRGLYRQPDPVKAPSSIEGPPPDRRTESFHRNSPVSLSVNIALCAIRDDDLKVRLIRRPGFPGGDCWTIPGGHIGGLPEAGLEEAALRMLGETAGLTDVYFEQLKTYGNADRTSDVHIITAAYFALAPFEKLADRRIPAEEVPVNAGWFSLRGFQKEMEDSGGRLARGHAAILADLLTRIRGKISCAPIAFSLVPERFTWPELRRVYEIVLGKSLDAANFKRKIRAMYEIREQGSRKAEKGAGRPASRLAYEGEKDRYL